MENEEEKKAGEEPEVEKKEPETEKPAEAEVAEEPEKDEKPKKDKSGSKIERFKHWYASHKKISVPLTVLLLVGLIFAIPPTRYMAAGTVLKKNLSMQVLDSTANTPVSGATVSAGSVSGITDGEGKVTLKNVKVGERTVLIAKKYYEDKKAKILVPILVDKGVAKVSLVATGRQAEITISDLISQKKLSGVEIKIDDIEAETDKDGTATVVLPVGTTSKKASFTLKGYNDSEIEIQASDKEIKKNQVNLTPSGKIYFLSKKSGKIDVVKTNLDGSERKTVLAGTGKEEDRGTVLLASRNWEYLALLSRRDSDRPKLYLIDTTDNDKLTTIDEGNVAIQLAGWSGNRFIYKVDRQNITVWQAKRVALKSYDASKKQLITIEETKAEGTSSNTATFEEISNIHLIDDTVVYWKEWESYDYYNAAKYSGKQDTVVQVNTDGGGRKTVKTFSYPEGTNNGYYPTSYLHEPREIYYSVYNPDGKTTYFEYAEGQFKEGDFKDEFASYDGGEIKTFLLSPKGEETFWRESRDGKNILFLGDEDAGGSKEIAALSDEYEVYGWYTDEYLLVSKKSSEIYILPRAGVKKDTEAVKITDYHKPSQTFFGYGGGYGGI